MNRLPNPLALPELLSALCLLVSVAQGLAGRPSTPEDTPTSCFTNVAANILRSQLRLDLHRIQIYPTNQYTPAVHRLLQVAANLYDSTTNRALTPYPYLPTVFRPLFTNDGSAIYVTGYAEETGTNLLSAPMRDLAKQADRDALQAEDMVYGVPVVIGVKKGFPNFNELELQTAVQVIRKLEFRRASIFTWPPVETNQMYIVGISNVLGIEAWNPYSNAFPRELQLILATDATASLTNELGTTLVSNQFSFGSVVDIFSNTWSGYLDPNHAQVSMRIPLFTNFWVLTNSAYSQSLDQFIPLPTAFERNGGFALPHWWVNLRTRLRFALVDSSITPNRIVDYVNVTDATDPIDITGLLTSGGQCSDSYSPPSPAPDGVLWCTNRAAPGAPTYGMRSQIRVCLGPTTQGGLDTDWNSSVRDFPRGMDKDTAIDFFRTNLMRWPAIHWGSSIYLTNVFYSPFNPTRTLYISTSWQANDPLVHHTLGDLAFYFLGTNRVEFQKFVSQQLLSNIGRINERYEPWGGNGAQGSLSQTTYALAVKDPLVWGADAWDFPASEPFDISSLGRVHRGTPWQTLYLKSPVAGPLVWARWLGFGDIQDAQSMHPTNDWRLVSALISLLAPENPAELLSVNEPNPVRWKRVLNGLVVLTNTSDAAFPFAPVQFESLVMHPDSSHMDDIIAGIEAARSNQPGQVWMDRGDVLATTNLSVASPWLNLSNPLLTAWSITDEAYEKIPSQLLQRLRSDSIGSVVRRGQETIVRFSGIDGCRYGLETSSDLLNWARVSTNYSSGGAVEMIDKSSATDEHRFYRSILLGRP